MKFILLILTLFFWSVSVAQNTQSPEQIRQEMARIRQTTNWDDPAAAKKANEQIKELAKKLMSGNSAMGSGAGQQQQQGADPGSKDGQKMSELNQEMMNQKMNIYSQIWKAGAAGKSAPILIAEQVREEIVKDFKEDDNKEVKNVDWLEAMNYLTINLSMPGVQAVIDQMEAFRGIEILIITADKPGELVNLNNILSKAKDYPLRELYIVNFGISVSTLPASIGNFAGLTRLSLLNNNIKQLPASVSKLTQLEILHADVNPIQSLQTQIKGLTRLRELGIYKTKIPDSEIELIEKALPNCEILR
ncbi:MAG TPA: hypothetical protein DER09_07265 [Prolixibacteraceae bacterium]|nr:hypothetical protein [Prolixibacteraceae bacterium]